LYAGSASVSSFFAGAEDIFFVVSIRGQIGNLPPRRSGFRA
jgi:hypothetical protein